MFGGYGQAEAVGSLLYKEGEEEPNSLRKLSGFQKISVQFQVFESDKHVTHKLNCHRPIMLVLRWNGGECVCVCVCVYIFGRKS